MDISLYIHIPFCLKKCLYCDFNSLADSTVSPEEYVAALLREMELGAAELSGPLVAPTLFFGGGTPSLLEPSLVGKVVDRAARLFGLSSKAEITIEANPGTLTPEKLAGYRAAGVNRLSLGVQSFDDAMLERLGRAHSAGQALDGFAMARRAGFDNIGIDLIHSLPGQTPDSWADTLARGVELSPEHVSAYGLGIEEGTPFHRQEMAGELVLPDEDASVRMFEATGQILAEAGYEQYEISNFARPGRRSRHNQVYWQRGNYLGCGAGAHSFLRSPGYGKRWKNLDAPADYVAALTGARLPWGEMNLLSREEAMSERLFLGLRMLEGIDAGEFAAEFGVSPDEAYGPALASFVTEGFLVIGEGRIRLSPDALVISNQLFSRLILI